MSTPTPNQGLQLPDSGDLNDVPTHLALYNTGVESRLVQRFTSATDRSVRDPSPTEGELSYLADIDTYEWYNGAGWVTLFAPGAWQSYTPIWGAASGVQPVLGNGTTIGRYIQYGKTVHFIARLGIGSTSTFGGGAQWSLSLPVNAQNVAGQLVLGRVFDTSAPQSYMVLGQLSTGTEVRLEVQSAGADLNAVRQGFPITFVSGDVVTVEGTYEAA